MAIDTEVQKKWLFYSKNYNFVRIQQKTLPKKILLQ